MIAVALRMIPVTSREVASSENSFANKGFWSFVYQVLVVIGNLGYAVSDGAYSDIKEDQKKNYPENKNMENRKGEWRMSKVTEEHWGGQHKEHKLQELKMFNGAAFIFCFLPLSWCDTKKHGLQLKRTY